MSHPDPTREYEDEQQRNIEAERLWRCLEILQKVRAAGCLDDDELENLKIFLGLKGDL
jgi:hypothetical protein